MILYDAIWAPSPRRVRIYLAEKGLEVPRETVDLRAGGQFDPAFLAVNPRGAVPALVLDDGSVITESAAICRYFEALHPEPALFGTTPLDVARIESRTRQIEGDGYAAVVYVLRNGAPAFADRAVAGKWPPIPQLPELVRRGAILWEGFVHALDGWLAQSPHVAGDAYSFADITALVTIDFARAAKLAVPEGCRHVLRWHGEASARPSAAA